ncbi:MAG: hypothetical protein DRP59_09900 [Spirochaetes bacterium]|nr:MAG: hypothetical protein DRP59_09900 [Spirochaetota bacterium]
MDKKEKGKYIKKILAIGAPLLAGNLSFYLLQVADTIMVGRLGTESLGAIAMAGLFTGILTTFIWPVSVGVQVLAARRYGKVLKDAGKESLFSSEQALFVGNTLDNGIVTGIIMGFISFSLSFSAHFWLSLLIKDPYLVPLALSYIRVIRWALPVMGIMMSIIGFLGGVRRTGYIMVVNVGGSLVNIFLNYIFIFGKWGFPPLGIAGAALGTIGAGILESLFLLGVVLFKKRIRQYRALHFRRIEPKMIFNMLKVFSPVLVQNVFALTVFLVYESIIGKIGTVYLAATHVIFSIFRINKTIVGGFARGASILIGNALGAEDRDDAITLMHGAFGIGSVIGGLILVIVFLAPEGIVGIFTKDPDVLAIGLKAMYFFAAFFFIEVLGYTLEMIFAGIGWGRYVLFSESTTNILFILGLTVLLLWLKPGWGVYSAWSGFAVYQLGHAAILFAGYLSKRWLKIEVEKKT